MVHLFPETMQASQEPAEIYQVLKEKTNQIKFLSFKSEGKKRLSQRKTEGTLQVNTTLNKY